MLYILSIIIFNIIVYWRKINFQYVTDDWTIVRAHSTCKHKNWNKACKIKKNAFCTEFNHEICKEFVYQKDKKRPDWWQILWLHLTGREYHNAKHAHIMQIVLHTITSVMVYIAFGSSNQSFIASILFSINPFNNEGAMWLSGKWYTLNAAMVLLAWSIPLIAPVIFLLIPLFAVTMLPAPVMFIFKSGYWWVSLFVFLVFAIKFSHIFDKKGSKISSRCDNKEAFVIAPRKIIIALKFYGYYFTQCLFGLKCATFHKYNSEYLVTRHGTEKSYKIDYYCVLGLLLITTITYLCFFIPVKPGKWLFGLIWFSVMILPFCNAVSVGNMLVSMRYAYLANAGLMLAVSFIPYAWIFLSGWYLMKLNYVIVNYKNDYWNNEFQIIEEPEYSHSWLSHGQMMFARGHLSAALQDFYEALSKKEHLFKVWFNISSVFVAAYNIPDAIIAIDKSKEYDLQGQETTKENVIREREELIGKMYAAQQSGKPLQLKLEEIPLII